MYGIQAELERELADIRSAGLWKDERVLASPQGPVVRLADGRDVLVFCANNYLGLSSHPEVIAAAHRALDARGFGLSSVRFICGTQDAHQALERRLADFVGAEDCILYAACFDANGGVFEPLLGEPDAIISDALNHASIIDGVRLCRAQRWRYEHGDMADLERCLREADGEGLPPQADRHRRCVQHGRPRRRPDGHLRARRSPPGDGDGGRLPCHRLRRPDGTRHRRAARRDGPRSTSSPARSARPWAAPWVASPRRARKSWRCCASARGPTCSRTRCRRRWWGRAWRCSICLAEAASCASGW